MIDLEATKEKIESNTVNYLSQDDLDEIQILLKSENERLYKRFAGHFHKLNDTISELSEDVEDLKIFIKYALKGDD